MTRDTFVRNQRVTQQSSLWACVLLTIRLHRTPDRTIPKLDAQLTNPKGIDVCTPLRTRLVFHR